MNRRLTTVAAAVGMVAWLAGGSTATADIVSGLRVHYEFENTANLGENSAGPDGLLCGA